LLREDDDTVRELLDLPEEPLEKTLAAFKTGMAKLKQIPGNSPSRSRIPQGIPEAELTKAYHFSLRKPGIHRKFHLLVSRARNKVAGVSGIAIPGCRRLSSRRWLLALAPGSCSTSPPKRGLSLDRKWALSTTPE